MIYLNQAATTYPKPDSVIRAVEAVMAQPPFSQNRAVGSSDSGDVMMRCRRNLAQLFHIENEKRIYLTSGATDSFNRVVRGLSLDHANVLATKMEHNALLRPLCNIVQDAQIEFVQCDEKGELFLDDFYKKLAKKPKAVFVNHCSNVTGAVVPIEDCAAAAHDFGAILVADVSQSAGMMQVDVEEMGADIVVFTGHKGLFGPQGTGGFYVREGLRLAPSFFGGTGRDSHTICMPPDYEEQEAGTQNMPGYAGLAAGVQWVLDTGVDKIEEKEQQLVQRLRKGLASIPGVTLYGNEDNKGCAVSFNIDEWKPQDAAYILAQSYGIVLRSGLHCAPLVHECIHSERYGTVRASVSYSNNLSEIEVFLNAVSELAQAV